MSDERFTSPPVIEGREVRQQRLTPAQLKAPWKLRDRLGLAFCWFAGLFFCAVALAIVLFIFAQGIKHLTPSLLWTRPQGGFSDGTGGGGLFDPFMGTLICAVMATAIAMPIGVALAVWLSEFGRPFWLARATESGVEMIAGAPSIVLALFGVVVFTHPALGFLSRTTTDGIVLGRSFFAAAAMLSLVALPLIVGATREGLQAIPGHVREASYAVGKSRYATIRRVLLPSTRTQIVTGTALGMGRVIGDTAIIVVLLGASLQFFPAEGAPGFDVLRGTGSTLTNYVFNNSPTGDGNKPDQAYAAACLLLLCVLALNVAIGLINRRSSQGGAAWKA